MSKGECAVLRKSSEVAFQNLTNMRRNIRRPIVHAPTTVITSQTIPQYPRPTHAPLLNSNSGGMENGIGRPKRPEPKEDDLGFDPSQFALDQLDLTRNKLNDMNLNPRQPNKPR